LFLVVHSNLQSSKVIARQLLDLSQVRKVVQDHGTEQDELFLDELPPAEVNPFAETQLELFVQQQLE